MTCTSEQKRFPASNPMRIDIEECDGICILHCHGCFVSGPEIEYMQSKLNDVKRMPCARVLADFQDVSYIGSMGVGFLVGIYTSVMRKPGGRFLLTGVSPFVEHVLDLTRLSTIIPRTSDVASGLARLRAEPMPPGAL